MAWRVSLVLRCGRVVGRVQRPVKIIILGAGQVGGTLAEHLADEQNDITVVD